MNVMSRVRSYSKTFAQVCTVAAITAIPASVWAKATFSIWPIYPKIEANEKAVAVWLENTGNEPAMVQVRVFKWMQNNGQDNYEQQTSIIPSPPVIKVGAGEKQMIRLARTIENPAGVEQAYRVVIDELPAKLAKEADDQTGVQFQMRYSLPLFTYGAGLGSGDTKETKKLNAKNPNARPILSWRIASQAGKEYLEVSNRGQVFTRLSGFKAGSAQDEARLGDSSFGYVLPGSAMRFQLTPTIKQQISQGVQLYGIISLAQEPIAINKE